MLGLKNGSNEGQSGRHRSLVQRPAPEELIEEVERLEVYPKEAWIEGIVSQTTANRDCYLS